MTSIRWYCEKSIIVVDDLEISDRRTRKVLVLRTLGLAWPVRAITGGQWISCLRSKAFQAIVQLLWSIQAQTLVSYAQ